MIVVSSKAVNNIFLTIKLNQVKKLNEIITGKMKHLVAMMSVLLMITLFATTPLRTWGANKQILKLGGETCAFMGIVASFKKKGQPLTEDEQKAYAIFDEIMEANQKELLTNEEFKKQFDELKSTLTPEALKKLTEGIVEKSDAEIRELLAKHGKAIDQLNTLGLPSAQGKGKSLKEQIKEQLQKPENAALVKEFQAHTNRTTSMKLEIKAAGTMEVATTTAYTTAATALGIPFPELIPGLNNVARNQPFIMQLLNVMNTAKANIVYTEKYNPQGTAGWVGEGVASSQVSFDIRIGESRAKRVSAYIKVSVEMLDDIDYMASEIEKELIYQIAISIDTNLLQGNGAGENLNGIASYASAYVLTGANAIYTTLPNNVDAIMAAATQIAHDNFRPDIAVMNTIDYNQVKLLKGTTGYYLINPNAENSKWGGITVVPSNQVPVGYIMVMDSSKSNVYRYQDFTLAYGWVDEDFTNNLVTILANQRLHAFVKNNDTNAFVYDTLSNIKAAITAV